VGERKVKKALKRKEKERHGWDKRGTWK